MFSALVDTVLIFSSFLVVLVTLVFIVAVLKKDNSIMDIAYGPLFFLSGLGTLLFTKPDGFLPYLILGLTFLWATRLSLRIFRKNHGQPEDIRYANWRTLWSKQGYVYFLIRSFLQINLLQGFIIFIVSLPFILSVTTPSTEPSFTTYVGCMVFFFGLLYESIADWQLDRFIARKKAGTEPAPIMKTGLFRFSRRPNYFGETLIWWGLALIALPLPFGFLAFLSPLTITFIVTKVTGPMLEQVFLEKYGTIYVDYMRETSYFFPLPPKTPVK